MIKKLKVVSALTQSIAIAKSRVGEKDILVVIIRCCFNDQEIVNE
jgi:hypothetical protein